ncbi:TPA: hypothetical protein HA249_05355 [Candidatus Woesearchaeota archaeon]|nr:hypothetical protein [Candidatus Woesearchaeota archaeon]HII89360.1 hypothetical protein [Candidatus Woesearchaeota archaeon]
MNEPSHTPRLTIREKVDQLFANAQPAGVVHWFFPYQENKYGGEWEINGEGQEPYVCLRNPEHEMIIKQVANILFFNVRKLDAIPMRRALDPRFSYLDHVRVDRPFDHPVINDVLDSMANLTDTSGKHKDETKA